MKILIASSWDYLAIKASFCSRLKKSNKVQFFWLICNFSKSDTPGYAQDSENVYYAEEEYHYSPRLTSELWLIEEKFGLESKSQGSCS